MAGKGSGRGGPMGRGGGRGGGEAFVRDDHSFDPRNIFKLRFPPPYYYSSEILEKPKVLGSYSIDDDREFSHDQSMIRFLDQQYLPQIGEMKVKIDLNKGSDKFIRYWGNAEENFQNFLRWILNNQDRVIAESSERLTADFISAKKNFNNIMRTFYNFCQPWTMYATEFKGSVYIVNWKRQEDIAAEDDLIKDNISKWGHTFERIVTGDPKGGIDVNEEYRCVLKTSIGGTSLLYASKVDCVDPEQFEEDFEDLNAFVAVRCCKELTNVQEKKKHKKFKLSKWWIENLFSGSPRILVGYRKDDGVVHTLDLLKTDELPKMAEGEWNPNVCFNFLDKFLAYVKETVSSAPGTTFLFDRESKGHIYCTKLEGEDHIDLLPSWYTEGLFADKEEDSD